MSMTKNTYMRAILAMVHAGLISNVCAAQGTGGSGGGAAPRTSENHLTEDEASAQLESRMPGWDEAELQREPPAAKWEAPDRPREFAMKFVDQEFTFAERRGGRDLYWSADKNVFLSADVPRGLFSVLRNLSDDAVDSGTFGLERAEEEARVIFREAGAPEVEQGDVFKSDLMRAFPGEKPHAIARHVRFHRKANGLRVRDSLWMVTFDLEGKPLRIEAKWPQFKLAKSTELRSRDEALKTLKDELSAHVRSKIGVREVQVDLAYEQVDGAFEPMLSVWAFTDFGSPQLIQFSLVSGLRPASTDDKADPPTDR